MSYRKGQWLAICDRCGMRFLSDEMRSTWDGLKVDPRCWEERHPQEFIRPVMEAQPTWLSPEPAMISVSPFLYVDAGYWDLPSIVPPANFADEMYVGES